MKKLRYVGVLGVAVAGLLAGNGLKGQTRTPSGSTLRTFDTPYYTLYTDLGPEEAREADLRMTRMYEEYQRRTGGFAGQARVKFPFYLYQNREDYLAAGAPKGSGGVFIQSSGGSKLMAIAGPRTTGETWHTVQHEGFHQFLAATVKFDVPIWANEGLAEYFGESLWTGDGFVTGLIPPDRLERIKASLRARRFRPFAQMMTMSNEDWGDKLTYANYDQAWAMVHFLAQAENGKYQAAFVQFLQKAGTGTPAAAAWKDAFGNDTAAFEARFAKWWMELPENPTRAGYMKSLVQIETSFYARAMLQKQTFATPAAFFSGYKPADLTLNRELWLPPSLFKEASTVAPRIGEWSFGVGGAAGAGGKLVCVEEDKTRYTGTFTVANGRVTRVVVEVVPGPGAGATNGANKSP